MRCAADRRPAHPRAGRRGRRRPRPPPRSCRKPKCAPSGHRHRLGPAWRERPASSRSPSPYCRLRARPGQGRTRPRAGCHCRWRQGAGTARLWPAGSPSALSRSPRTPGVCPRRPSKSPSPQWRARCRWPRWKSGRHMPRTAVGACDGDSSSPLP